MNKIAPPSQIVIRKRIKDFENRGITFSLKDGEVIYSSKNGIPVPSALVVFLNEFQEQIAQELTEWQTSQLGLEKAKIPFSIEMATAKIDELMADPLIITHHQFIDALDKLPSFNYDPFWEGVVKLYETLYYNGLFYWNTEISDDATKDVVAVPLKNWIMWGLKTI